MIRPLSRFSTATILAGLAAILALGVVGAWGYSIAISRAVSQTLRLVDPPSSDKPTTATATNPPQPQPPSDAPLSQDLTDLLKSKKVFGGQDPQTQVQAILGQQALVNGQWMKIGDQNGPVKLIGIEDDKVILEVEGQRREVTIWQAMPSQPPSAGPPSPPQQSAGPTPQVSPAVSPPNAPMPAPDDAERAARRQRQREIMRERVRERMENRGNQ